LLCKNGRRSFIPDTINSIGAEPISLYLVIHSPRQKQFHAEVSGLNLTSACALRTAVLKVNVTARTGTLEKRIAKRLAAVERNVFRRIFGGSNVNENWRKRYNN